MERGCTIGEACDCVLRCLPTLLFTAVADAATGACVRVAAVVFAVCLYP